jgi:hypothetical protein
LLVRHKLRREDDGSVHLVGYLRVLFWGARASRELLSANASLHGYFFIYSFFSAVTSEAAWLIGRGGEEISGE